MPQLAIVSNSPALGRPPAAQAAHDLRNLLATLGLHLETLQRLCGPTGAKAADAANSLLSRSASLCNDVLARAAEAEGPRRRRGVDVASAAQQVADLLVSTAPEGFAFAIERSGPVSVLADPDDVFRILFNLMSNALAVARTATLRTVAISVAAEDRVVAIRSRGRRPRTAGTSPLPDCLPHARQSHRRRTAMGSRSRANLPSTTAARCRSHRPPRARPSCCGCRRVSRSPPAKGRSRARSAGVFRPEHGSRALRRCGTFAAMATRKTIPLPVSPLPRAWQRMLSGRRLDLLDPSPLDIEIEDIAHGLARVARWNGQTDGPHIFSVAQHSLLVETIARARVRIDRRHRRAVLLHDAPEYVIGDMISPFKAIIGDSYKSVEARLLAAIHLRFGLPPVLPADLTALIKAADRGAAYLEATRLAGFATAEAKKFFGRPPKFSAVDRARLSHALAGRRRGTALSRPLRQARGGLTLSRSASSPYIRRE